MRTWALLAAGRERSVSRSRARPTPAHSDTSYTLKCEEPDKPRGYGRERRTLRGNVHHAPPVRKVPAGPQGLAGLRADAPSEARGADGGRARRRPKHRCTASKNTGDTANRNTSGAAARTPATQPTEHRRHSRNAGMREARRRVAASGPLRKDHLSLIRSSHVRRSPTRMPKSRFWSAMAASVAGFLMRAASTSGAAVMAPTP